MFRSAMALLAIVLMLAGCSKEPTVNAKGSDEETRDSIEAVKDSLPSDQQDDFEEAMKALVFADVAGLQDLADADGIQRRFADRIHGKTGEEIITEAEQIRAERKEKERREAIAEIEEIAAKLDPAAEEMCARFVVGRSRFTRGGGGLLGGPGIELTVRNDTGHAISRVHFSALLLTPGREIPWVDAEFNYQIPGGLEPGESAEWSLQPNMFGEWSNAPDDRSDTVFIVRAIGLEGAGGESLIGERFTKADRDRLLSLMDAIDFEGEEKIRAFLESRDEMVRRWVEAASRRTALAELEELRVVQAAAAEARTNLSAFEVERSRFYWNEDRYMREPVIDVTVRNGTSEVVTRFYARGILSSPGREAPWIDDTFNYSVRGGLESGESRQFKLAPNQFGTWGSAPKDRGDMVLTVEITRIDGADGEQLFASEWEDEDAERLAALTSLAEQQGW